MINSAQTCFDRNKKLKYDNKVREDERLDKKFGNLGKRFVKNEFSDICSLDMKDQEFLEFRKYMKS